MQLIFNSIGGGEIFIILIFILIFFGAKSVPGLARTAGKTIRQVREASSEIQNEIRKSGDDMKKDLNLRGMIEETADDIRRPLDQYADDLQDAVKYQPPKKTGIKKPMGHDPKEVIAPDTEKDKTEESKANDKEDNTDKKAED